MSAKLIIPKINELKEELSVIENSDKDGNIYMYYSPGENLWTVSGLITNSNREQIINIVDTLNSLLGLLSYINRSISIRMNLGNIIITFRKVLYISGYISISFDIQRIINEDKDKLGILSATSCKYSDSNKVSSDIAINSRYLNEINEALTLFIRRRFL